MLSWRRALTETAAMITTALTINSNMTGPVMPREGASRLSD